MDWWKEAIDNKSDLMILIEEFHPFYKKKHQMPISAPTAELACENIRKEIKTVNPLEKAEAAYEAKDGETLWNLFNETWFGMPESMSVRECAGFGVLCDLCSEYEGESYE